MSPKRNAVLREIVEFPTFWIDGIAGAIDRLVRACPSTFVASLVAKRKTVPAGRDPSFADERNSSTLRSWRVIRSPRV
jgi:hypothetical protein